MPRGQKLLIANRGEIAVRIIRTAKELGLATVAIYSPSDALSPHVSLADESVLLPTVSPEQTESKLYLSGSSIVEICLAHSVTFLHPGYGFLSENAEFASLVIGAGITWLGPRPEVIRLMGLKHEARRMALRAGLPVVSGSDVVDNETDALASARKIGFPIMLKATAGGGGMGMVVCPSDKELKDMFSSTRGRAKELFGDEGLYIERYVPEARHIEIQVFGNGAGGVVHMGERECSIQRRQQKIIEETPSPFFLSHPGLKDRMYDAALSLCRLINYSSAGTVEFLVDYITAEFYFLEMNTRLQVEHPITEVIHPGLDIVKLMIQLGFDERQNLGLMQQKELEKPDMQQSTYNKLRIQGKSIHAHAIEGRVYAENPSEGFLPSPGVLQFVDLNSGRFDWLRVDSWVSTGVSVVPFFDALLCKLIVTGKSRAEAISRFRQALDGCKILGPPTNIEYLKAIADSDAFRAGKTTTKFLDDFTFTAERLKILSPGIECTIQDLPGRNTGLGIPHGGPMDSLAFRAGNILIGNPVTTEGLEIVVLPGVGFESLFSTLTVVSVTGKNVLVKVDNESVNMWTRIIIRPGGRLRLDIDSKTAASVAGFRVYITIRGGFPNVPTYLGSKSTSMGLGGYQGRSLLSGDELALRNCGPEPHERLILVSLPVGLIPKYPLHWVIYVLPGPQDDEEFITAEGIYNFYSTIWGVSTSVNRTGIRLKVAAKINWNRTNGGEGGSHPSNILDNAYAPGAININGDTPVILGRDGPDMGGYVSVCTIASAEMWKLGQLNPGCTVEFRRLTWSNSVRLNDRHASWLRVVNTTVEVPNTRHAAFGLYSITLGDSPYPSILHATHKDDFRVTFRQAGDGAILVEFGTMRLDLIVRAYIHAFQSIVEADRIDGMEHLRPCVRSVMCHFNPKIVSQHKMLSQLIAGYEKLPTSVADMNFPGRRITFPIVLDDPWNRDALARYMQTTRQKAVYLPSNIEYLARNNGLVGGPKEVLEKLVGSDWLVLGVGFYLGCPFMVPLDPRCRIIGQKMNPSRTYTPRGAIGIAGPVAAIYPVESPGGYQLYGRTLPTWKTWGNGKDFRPERPWFLKPFDQVHFEVVNEDEYLKFEKAFDMGQYTFEIEPTILSMSDYGRFLEVIAPQTAEFRRRQAVGMAGEEKREYEYLQEWEATTALASSNTKSDDHEGKGESSHNKLNAHTPVPKKVSHDNSFTITAPLFASVWKILIQPGEVIQSGEDVVMVLEAMKTEIPIHSGTCNVGRSLERLGSGIAEGSLVRPGDVLLVLV